MLKTLFKKLGLTEKEIEIYLAINSFGPCAVSLIAKTAGLPRQTVYSILQKLIQDGFVEQSDKQGVKQFFTNPQRLPIVFEEKTRELIKNKLLIEKAIPELLAQQKRLVSLPKVVYYEGKVGLKTLLNGIIDLYKQSPTEKEFRGFGVNQLGSTDIEDVLRDFIQRRSALCVATKLLIGNGSDDFEITNESNRYGREVKRLNIPHQQAAAYLVGNRIYLFSYADNVGIMIENQAMVKLLKNVFDAHWQAI
jgi:predicted transcriptional regulator